MKKIDAIVIVIDDDITLSNPDSGLYLELDMSFRAIHFFQKQEEGINFIKSNLEERLIVLLDLGFPSGTPDGHKILEMIRDDSFLIPVIIWSGVDEDKEVFADLINNKAFAFLNKNASSEEIITKLTEAYNYVGNDVSVALEDWISTHSKEEREKPYMLSIDGKELSLNDILKAIRLQTTTGKQFSKKLTKLTIDLLIRKKESLND